MKQNLKRIQIYSTLSIAVLALIILLFPATTHAEAIQQILSTDQNIKDIHSAFLNIIDIPIILAILVIAFAEMLHLKIDTYGFKKILPSLILAIIAAQFSYLFCKLVIDAANMALTLFTDPRLLTKFIGVQKGGIASSFSDNIVHILPNYDFQTFTYADTLPVGIKIIFMLVASVLTLVMAFLFIARTWMIYLLVTISSLAFLALALPQTKPYFDKWWKAFFQWAFMPIPSIALLWLGKIFLDHPLILGSWIPDWLTAAIFASICLSLAIAMPFRIGGPIMDKFWHYSGTKWALNKAKSKWVEPWIDDMKRRANVSWLSQASWKQNSPLGRLNPLGAIVRRAHRVGWEREQRKREEEGWRNQGLREALGGKLGNDGDNFMSNKRQVKYGRWLDNIDSLFGEKEWKEQDLREKFFRTAEGKSAALRSAQYGFRMEGTEQLIKNAKTVAKNKALAFDEEYTKDDHYKRMVEISLKSRGEAFALDMETKKLEGDIFQTMEGNAYLLDMAVQGVNDWSAKIKELNEKLRAAGDAERPAIQRQIAVSTEKLNQAEKSYQETVRELLGNDDFYDKKTGKFKGESMMFKQMIQDDKGKLRGIVLDADGKVISADATQAKALADLMGYNRGTKSYGYYEGRRTKRLSIIGKEELASVQGKRTAEDSRNEIDSNPREQRALIKILSDNYGGMDEYQLRKTNAELANIILGAGDINSSAFAPNHTWLLQQQTNLLKEKETALSDEAKAVRGNVSSMIGASLGRLGGYQSILDEARRKAALDFENVIDAAVERENVTRASQGESAMTDAQAKAFKETYVASSLPQENAQYRETLNKQLKESLSRWTKVEGTANQKAWDELVDINFNEVTGQIEAKVKSDEANANVAAAEAHAKLMQAVGTAVINGTPRGPMGDAKSAYLGRVKEIFGPGRREAGKQVEQYLGYDKQKFILAQAAKAPVPPTSEEEEGATGD